MSEDVLNEEIKDRMAKFTDENPVSEEPVKEPAEPIEEPAEPVEELEETIEAVEETAEPAEPVEELEETSSKKRNARDRIQELAQQKREAEDKVVELEKKLAKDEETPEKPDPNHYDGGILDDKYTEDYEKYSEYVAQEERRSLLEDAKKEIRIELERENIKARWDEHCRVGNSKYNDFDQVVSTAVNTGDFVPTDEMKEYILAIDSDSAADMLYHFSSNPSEARRISKLPPIAQGIEIAGLKSLLKTKSNKDKKLTKARPLPTGNTPSPKGTSSVTSSRDNESFSDRYRRWKRDGRL